MRVRELEDRDVEAAAALSAGAFERPWTAVELDAERARPGSVCLVADDGGVRGMAIARRVLDEAELLTIAVEPSARRRGIGRALVEALLAREGLATVHLEVRADAAPARALYRAAGFEEVGRRRGYYPGGVDAVLMTWARGGGTR